MHGHRSGPYSPLPKHRSCKVPEHRSGPCKSTDTSGMRVKRKMPEHTSVASKMQEPRTGPCKMPGHRSGPCKMPRQPGPSDG